MRNIVDVVDQMLRVLPADEAAFKGELVSLRSSALYAAPESARMWWSEFHRIINDYLPHPDKCTDWQLQIGMIFMDKQGITTARIV